MVCMPLGRMVAITAQLGVTFNFLFNLLFLSFIIIYYFLVATSNLAVSDLYSYSCHRTRRASAQEILTYATWTRSMP